MTPRSQVSRQPRQATPLPAAHVAPVVPLAITAALSAWVLSRSFPPELEIAGLLLLLIVGSTLLVRSTLIPALLFLTQLVMAATEQGSLRHHVESRDQIIAGSLLALLLSSQRYLQVPEPARLKRLLKQFSDRLPRWLSLSRSPTTPEQTTFHASSPASDILLIGMRAMAAVIVATLLLELVPNNLRAPDDVGLIPTAQRTIKLSLGIAVAVILINTLFNSVAWRRVSPRAARLFLHSELTEWCGREIRTILRLEEKQKRRRR